MGGKSAFLFAFLFVAVFSSALVAGQQAAVAGAERGERIPISVSACDMQPAVFMPHDVGTVTVTLKNGAAEGNVRICLLYTSPSPRDRTRSRMPSSA